jgi:hypothetical protein
MTEIEPSSVYFTFIWAINRQIANPGAVAR